MYVHQVLNGYYGVLEIHGTVLHFNSMLFARDYAIGPDSYKLWLFKNSEVVIYKGGHTSYQEEPDWFAEKVLNFLKNK